MDDRPLLIGSDIHRTSRYADRHPLAIPRVSTVLDLIAALGWLEPERYRDAPLASPDELTRFHTADYVAALHQAERTQSAPAEIQQRYNFGCAGNPVFAEMYRRPATACGASLLAADLLASGASRTIFSPGGGTHHGRPDRASGFCYFNDPALAILRLLDRGLARVLYIDLDAHHGDGVEDAFAGDPRVLCLSVHEAGRWPFTGTANGPCARNFPVPAGFNDAELAAIVDRALVPLGLRFDPLALVLQCGADGLADDPLSKLGLSNRGLWDAVARLVPLAPRRLILGGGGYNPWSVARCWTGVWATLDGHAIPERLPDAAEALLRALTWNRSQGRNPPEHWFTTLADPPASGPIRPLIDALIAAALHRPLGCGDTFAA